MNLALTGGPGLGWWVPHVGDKRCFSFGGKQLTAGGSLSLPPTPLSPPNRPITSINSQATLHLHQQLLLDSRGKGHCGEEPLRSVQLSGRAGNSSGRITS